MSVFVTREAGTLKAIFDFPMFNTTLCDFTTLIINAATGTMPFGNIPRMFTPFTLRIGMNWPMPTRPKHLRNWKRWPGKSFELYSALSSFGSSTFSRIATNAAGTMPDSPQIS